MGNTSYENGTESNQSRDLFTDVTQVTLVSVLILITIFGNVLVIISILREGNYKKKCIIFILSLAVTDLSVGLFVMIPAVFTAKVNEELFLTFPETVCLVFVSTDVMFTTSSILHLACLTVERYTAICHPFKYALIWNRKSVIACLVACWVLPAGLSYAIIFSKMNRIGIEHLYEGLQTCLFFANVYYEVIGACIAFYIPAILIVAMNVKIVRHVHQVSLDLRYMTRNSSVKRDIKVFTTVLLLTVCFLMSCFPFFFLLILKNCYVAIPTTIRLVALWLGYSNSTLNPYLYYFRKKHHK